MSSYAKKNISTEQSQESEDPRVSQEDVDQGRSQHSQAPPEERTQKTDAVPLLDRGLPKQNRLRKPKEFRRVYAEGVRIKGRFMTAFVMPSETSFQRLGITASRKAVGKAVARNRAKRLLREAFRLSRAELGRLGRNYDWVFNARGELPGIKMPEALEDLRRIIREVARRERTDTEERSVRPKPGEA